MQFSFAQEKTVTGTITDGKLPLPGANVVIKGTTNGVAADMDGKFSIKAKAGDVLVVSFTGYDNKTLTVGAANSYKVALNESATILKEVVVGAVGIKKKKDAVTSSSQVVSSRELTQAVNPNVVQSLAGKVSGLQINTVSNGVNAETRIVLRGTRTITGDSQALIVIDNVVSSASVLSQLPPEIIESVNVLKGQQGAALYGEVGSNGVIIVSTKKGSKSNKPRISVNTSVDFEEILFLPKRQEKYGQGWAVPTSFDDGTGNQTYHDFLENGAWGEAFQGSLLSGTMQATGLPQADGSFIFSPWAPIKDNIKKFFKTGTTYQNGFSMNFGNDEGYALFSANRQNTDFVVAGDNVVRNSFLFKGGKKLGKFTIDGNVNFVTAHSTETDASLMDELLNTATNIPVEKFAAGENQHHWTVYYKSPYWMSRNLRYDDRSEIWNGVLTLGYEINKNINVNYTNNVQLRNVQSEYHNNGYNTDYEYNLPAPYLYNGSSTFLYSDLTTTPFFSSSYYIQNDKRRSYYSDFIVNFNYDLTKDLNFKLNLGNNIQDNRRNLITNGGTGLDKPGIYNVNNLLNPNNVDSSAGTGATPGQFIGAGNRLDNRLVESRKVAYFANADFGYKDYLFLNATARYEKTSVVKGSQFYPSAGVSFIPTKAFSSLKDNSVLNYAKISANITVTGNTSNVLPYEISGAPGILGTGYPFGASNSYVNTTSNIDPDISPEYVISKELNLSLGFLKNRITLEGSVYKSDTKDLITNKTTSSASGLARLKTNVGDMENKGFEIDLGVTPIKTKNFSWDMKASYTTFKSVVTSLADGVDEVNLQSNAVVGIFAQVGQEFPLIKGTSYVRDGLGNVVLNANNVPVINNNFTILGKATPDYIIGFTNSFEYKGLKLTTVADFRTGHSFFSSVTRTLSFAGHLYESGEFDREFGYVFPTNVEFPVGSGNYVPNTNPVNGGGNNATWRYYDQNYGSVAEAQLIDATALKIREISLSYSLPKKLIEKVGFESFRFGINARNPFVFLADGKFLKAKNGGENRGYADPEASNTTGNAQGLIDIGKYPTTKTYGFSINLTF
ncbi:SusC/RagA family TonB-linked outer membrane protein [Flavobacterium koreense]